MATSAYYVAKPVVEIAQVTTANTARDGTGNTVLVCAGPATAAAENVGKRISAITIKATGTTTAGMIRFFFSIDGGTTKRLCCEIPVVAITVSSSQPSFQTTVPDLVGYMLQGTVSSAACNLYASTEKTETFNIIVSSATM